MRVNFSAETPVEQITSDYATIVLPPNAVLKDFVLPLNPGDSTTTFVFDLGDVSKTLKVRYSRTEKTLADVCGPQRFFYDLRVNGPVTDLSSVTVSRDSLEDLPQINLEVTP
jgi:hypothetical protein